MPRVDSPARAIARNVLVIAGVVLVLYIIYLLRKPISWLVIAAFLAVALAGPVNFFQRYMKRGLAIALVYLGLLAIPIGLGAVLLPPIVNQVSDVATNAPSYVQDVEDYVNDNKTLRDLNEKYDITQKLSDEADKLPSKAGDAAKVLRDIGFGLVSSIFAGVTILILSIVMVASGPRWIEGFIRMQRPEHAERIERTLRRIANAVGNYVGGALLQATIAGFSAFIVLTILGVPFAGPLAVIIFVFDLIPVVGATIGAVLVAIVTAFVNFPIALIIWVVFAIVYQQVENYVIQPQIQKRATKIEAFIVLVAVLFGSTLFGVLGAILAIPAAATIQIAVQEYREYRRELTAAEEEAGGPTPAPEAT
jgi:predicted PurR-regulated permease PerM